MAALAARFEGHQVLWELTNEPNLNGWAGWDAAHAHRGNASGMGWFFRDVCGAMHKASPAALCVGPSTGFIGPGYRTLAWTQEFFETGALEEVDALLVHPYRCDGPETAIADMRALAGFASRPGLELRLSILAPGGAAAAGGVRLNVSAAAQRQPVSLPPVRLANPALWAPETPVRQRSLMGHHRS